MRPDAANHSRRRPLLRAGAIFCLFLGTQHLFLGATVRGQPQFFEPKEHYYKAQSYGFGPNGVRWEVPVRKVEAGREVTAVLVIGSDQYPVLNPAEVVKPDLSKLPAFADAFSVTDVKDPPPKPGAKEVRLTYRLKPRNRTVTKVPELEFYYFNPRAPKNKSQFRHTVAEEVPLTVTEPPPPEPKPMTEPDRLFRIATGPGVLDAPFVPDRWAWLAAALFGPLAAGAWYLAWRRVYPNAARLAHLRRSRAARRAVDAIRRAYRAPDPPATVAAAVLGYLRTRFPLPDSAVTPSEVAAALAESEVPGEVAEQVADVFRVCDRARFAPAGDTVGALATDAEAAVTRLEALA